MDPPKQTNTNTQDELEMGVDGGHGNLSSCIRPWPAVMAALRDPPHAAAAAEADGKES